MTRLHEALHDLAEEAPQTDLAGRVVTRARRRRRVRLLTAPVVAVGAATVVAAASLLGGPGRDTGPAVAPGERVLNAGALPKPLPGHQIEPVKYAYLDWCGTQRGARTGGCTQWRVVSRSGEQWLVADSLGSSPSTPGGSAPLEISADGRLIAYYRPSDEHIVVRDLLSGRVTVVGRRVSQRDAPALMFSGDGRRLAISFNTVGPVHALLADTATGEVHELPGGWVIGLGKDASTVTLAEDDGKRTTLVLAGPDGSLRRRVPLSPKLHFEALGNALASDGHTLLALPGPEKKGLSDPTPLDTVVLVDVRTGKEIGRRHFRLPEETSRLAYVVGWAGETKILLTASAIVPRRKEIMSDRAYVADLNTGRTQTFGTISLWASETDTTFGDFGS
ncbi:hypothetical protein GCM10023196_055640 [Actinoallomurus vinaceus]|uniref:Lipoprotein LpqB beta-propeller domain-containing protein n=1 Tax=Actinoallomurus vinaceus TaxID=1080074 RepID=A0ABP8UJA4_9ACTN